MRSFVIVVAAFGLLSSMAQAFLTPSPMRHALSSRTASKVRISPLSCLGGVLAHSGTLGPGLQGRVYMLFGGGDKKKKEDEEKGGKAGGKPNPL
jgi:hypothetical protein